MMKKVTAAMISNAALIQYEGGIQFEGGRQTFCHCVFGYSMFTVRTDDQLHAVFVTALTARFFCMSAGGTAVSGKNGYPFAVISPRRLRSIR